VRDHDVRIGKRHAGVVGGDRGVVPFLDVALEDLRDRVGGQLQLVDAVEVVRHRDAAEQNRKVEQVAALDLREVGVLERGVRAREVGHHIREVLPTFAGAATSVVDLDVGVALGERGDRALLKCLLKGRAAGIERYRSAAPLLATTSQSERYRREHSDPGFHGAKLNSRCVAFAARL
jgi:hypothetical protein